MPSATPTALAQLRALNESSHAQDGVAPFGEGTLLAAERGQATICPHLQERTWVGAAVVVGDTAELCVHPTARCHGIGTRLFEQARAIYPYAQWWAHGDLPGARGLATKVGMRVKRELLVLALQLPSPPVAFPVGWQTRAFRPGHDETALLRLNAAAFAQHPEQGRMGRADFDSRLAQPWFDPSGLLVLFHTAEPRAMRGFHWTKEHPEHGEVYVMALDPALHGRGLAGALLSAGLEHLYAHGHTTARLYVEADNQPALATYRRLGFTQLAIHRQYG